VALAAGDGPIGLYRRWAEQFLGQSAAAAPRDGQRPAAG